MIQIKHNDLDTLIEKHYNELSKKIEKEFPNTCKYTIKEILTSKPDKLHKIALEYKNNKNFDFMITLYKNFTTKKQEYNAYTLVSSLKVDSCPYCNRNYTFSVIKKGKILRPDIDHFYDKDTYPILALSFYNLIPSCIECNRVLKGTSKFTIDSHLHPYIDSLNNYAKFKLKILNSNFYYDTKGFAFEFKSKNEKAQNNINDLKLENIYKEGYKNIALELIQKAEIYNDSYIDELYKNYEGTLFKNREDVLRLITCGYMEDKDINKRPLSKLIKDISEELDLI